MNFQGKAVLVYLEEDNVTRAFFRIQPLLTEGASVAAEAVAAFPDDGFLRIVPDKNEQHTFKERMRGLCGLCLLDLRALPPEANKIRTNKNYAPARGENNQFIVYSDAIRPMPDGLFYQVVAEENLQSAATPQAYIRKGANIQGPFQRETAQPVGEITQLPPDSNEIYAVNVNGQELLFYWPRAAAPVQAQEAPAPAEAEAAPVAPAPVPAPAEPAAPAAPQEAPAPRSALEQIQEMNSALGDRVNRMRETPAAPVDYRPEQPQKPLVGTRLYQAPQSFAAPRRAHNPLMETVEQQRYAARYEAPGAVLPQNAEMKDVPNPVDTFKRALLRVWQTPETQPQAVDTLLAQPGIRAVLAKALSTQGEDPTLAAMHSQLQELEAERLMTLMQLDDAKKNLAAAREEILGEMSQDELQKLEGLRHEQQACKAALSALQNAAEPLEAARQEAEETIARAQRSRGALCVRARAGVACAKAELIHRVETALKAAGFLLAPGDALSLLAICALSEDALECRAANPADAYLGVTALAAALGAPVYDTEGASAVCPLPGGNSPVFLINPSVSIPAVTRVLLPAADRESVGGYARRPFASVRFAASGEAVPQALPVYPPVDRERVRKALLADAPLTEATSAALLALRKALAACGAPLSLITARRMQRFIAATQNDLPGGVAEALDRAVCAFALPHMLAWQVKPEAVLPLLSAMPRALRALKQA